MNWEETIIHIRKDPDYSWLVENAYFESDLTLNVERFRKSEEYIETLKKIKEYAPSANHILDIGSGNGISAISFALEGFNVVSVEPDPSDTIGAGAIRKLKQHYNLKNIKIFEAFAEKIEFEENKFDIVYSRQCMHHAYDLEAFVKECARVLKTEGLFFTVRDHVIFDNVDKQKFLEVHPLQKFYGGENAFKPSEYRNVITSSGLEIKEELKYFESVINYYPELKSYDMENLDTYLDSKSQEILSKKLGILSRLKPLRNILRKRIGLNIDTFLDEKTRPGRTYSYLATKKKR